MSLTSETISIILAGGAGMRLKPLTSERAKPAVPFGGKHRIIDFTLSNCLHSGLRQALVLTQYKPHSLHQHLQEKWSNFEQNVGLAASAVPSRGGMGNLGYRGTADAVYQNLDLLRNSGAKYVLILSGDHVYRMDYSHMLEAHRAAGADVTLACVKVELREASSFGIVTLDARQRIRSFEEKPTRPTPAPDNSRALLASMGIYVFSMDVLCRELERDAQDIESGHDFGHNVLPVLVRSCDVVGYRFGENEGRPSEDNYWRDVGTLDSYYRTSMDLLQERPPLKLNSDCWRIHRHERPAPAPRITRDRLGACGTVTNSILSDGVVVSGGAVARSILGPNVQVGSGAEVNGSILFDDVRIEDGARVRNCIIEKGVCVPAGETVGFDAIDDARRFTVSDEGVIVVSATHRFPSRQTQWPKPAPVVLSRPHSRQLVARTS